MKTLDCGKTNGCSCVISLITYICLMEILCKGALWKKLFS